ncbi:uncharacterized protein LOC117786607 [Drosophila innubila]|uniref:uncharacterized protein LOC117786607 n=1 Tax=Drosophila innubila TaxID=198719 RepID=UPI00148C3891|nr:uncharacterized protein LOC117786607 [Drosophila innubila]
MWPLLGLLLGLSNSSDINTLKLAEISCQIAVAQLAQVNYIYRCVSCPVADSVSSVTLEEALHRCVASRLPSSMRSLEMHELEPVRQTDSMNIFHIPAEDAGAPIMRRILDMLNPRQPRRHLHKYLFIWPEAKEKHLRQLFEGCWEKHLLFALAITGPQDIYDFDPFGVDGLELKRSARGRYIDKLRNLRGFDLRYSMFTNPLRALPLDPVETEGYKAIDGSIARLFAQKLNATARYVIPSDGEAYGRCLANGSFTGAVRDLTTGVTDIGVNLRFVLDCIWPHVELAYPYRRIIISLVVPAARMRPEYRIFVDAFRNSVWHLLLANFLFAFVIFIIFQWLLNWITGEVGERWFEVFDMLFKTHLGQPVEHFSRKSSLRAFLMAWIMFSYVLTTVYFGKLESSFVQPSYEQQLEDLDGLPALKLHVHGVTTMFDAVNSSLSARHYEALTARPKVHPLKDSDHLYELAISRRFKRAAFLMRDDSAKEFLAITYNAEEGRSAYHIVKQYLRSMPGTYILPLGSPYLYKFQMLMSAFFEFGFLDYWAELDVLRRSRSTQSDEFFEDLGDETEQSTDNGNVADSQERRKKRVVLTMDILQGAFYLWIIGILLSFVGFILEQVYYRLRRSKRGRIGVLDN